MSFSHPDKNTLTLLANFFAKVMQPLWGLPTALQNVQNTLKLKWSQQVNSDSNSMSHLGWAQKQS